MRRIGLILFLSLFALEGVAHALRIKELAYVRGVRPNELIGYGLVVGLNGTGDKSGTKFTIQSLANMLTRMGVTVKASDIKVKNVAAVVVTAKLPPFAKRGTRIDVVVSSIGDASSLQGGTLLLTPLRGADGLVYAVAQGPVSVGGFSVGGAGGGRVQKNHPTVGRIPGGALVEREVPLFLEDGALSIYLRRPDFTTAMRVAEAINRKMGGRIAFAQDAASIKVRVPKEYEGRIVPFIASIEAIEVRPDALAKVVIDERTGTIVMGERVRIRTVAVSHGNLSVEIKELKRVSQPMPFAPPPPAGTPPVVPQPGETVVAPGGQTVVVPESQVKVEEEKGKVALIEEGVTIGEVVRALNALGVSTRDLISILQAIEAAGALEGELEII